MHDLRIKEKNNINIILFCISISFANSDFQTFGDLAQCGASHSISVQGHRGNEIVQFKKPAENRVDQFFDDQMHRGYEIGQLERKEEEEQFSGGDQGK